MKIIRTVREMRAWSDSIRQEGGTVGFVPTMGFLHEGHISLVRESIHQCDHTAVSIFVNAKQFGPNEDLDTYPADFEGDRKQLESLNVDVLFFPAHDEIYPDGHTTFVTVEELSGKLCGKSRPGFFRGVTTVVIKLFNIVQPHIAFFGEKDRQQLGIIKKMVADLNLNLTVQGMPIIRDSDGLALSSRNDYLSKEDRGSSLSLSKALNHARVLFLKGETSTETIKAEMARIIENEKNTRIDYISLCHPDSFEEMEKAASNTLVALAVFVDKTRLIDNCILENS
ncbi:MAG: pantoate--beta-alanine ligase [Nitrospinales bacterium]